MLDRLKSDQLLTILSEGFNQEDFDDELKNELRNELYNEISTQIDNQLLFHNTYRAFVEIV